MAEQAEGQVATGKRQLRASRHLDRRLQIALEPGALNRSRCIRRARDNKAPGMVRSYEILSPHSSSN